jgi:hypothetical protein
MLTIILMVLLFMLANLRDTTGSRIAELLSSWLLVVHAGRHRWTRPCCRIQHYVLLPLLLMLLLVSYFACLSPHLCLLRVGLVSHTTKSSIMDSLAVLTIYTEFPMLH